MPFNHSMPRRRFLKHISVLAGAGAVGLSLPPTRAWSSLDPDRYSYLSWSGRVMLDKLTRKVFSDALGSTFKVHLEEGGSMDVSLIEAVDLPNRLPRQAGIASREPFSIVFRGRADVVLPQMIYKFEHDKIGEFNIFIVPIGPDDEGMRYEAVFS